MADWSEQGDWRARLTARRLSERRAAEHDAGRRVVQAAIELVASGGADFSVQEVAERAGVSRRKFYELFPGKDDLILALLTDLSDHEVQRRRARVEAAAGTPAERLRRALEMAMDHDASDDPFLRAVAELDLRLTASRAADVRVVMEPWTTYFAELVAACRADGSLTSPVDDLLIAAFVENAVHQRLLRDRLHPDPNDPPAEVFVELLLHGALGGGTDAQS